MKVKVRNIQQRGDAFFFRMAIPASLKSHYEGRSEISVALRTSNPFEANMLAVRLAAVYRKQFKDLRAGKQVELTHVGADGYLSDYWPLSSVMELKSAKGSVP